MYFLHSIDCFTHVLLVIPAHNLLLVSYKQIKYENAMENTQSARQLLHVGNQRQC